MEFALSEGQKMLEASLRGLLSNRLPMERRRAIASAGNGHDRALGIHTGSRAEQARVIHK